MLIDIDLRVTGDHHRKQRRMLNPVFSANHLRQMTPLFYHITNKVRQYRPCNPRPRLIEMHNMMIDERYRGEPGQRRSSGARYSAVDEPHCPRACRPGWHGVLV